MSLGSCRLFTIAVTGPRTAVITFYNGEILRRKSVDFIDGQSGHMLRCGVLGFNYKTSDNDRNGPSLGKRFISRQLIVSFASFRIVNPSPVVRTLAVSLCVPRGGGVARWVGEGQATTYVGVVVFQTW